MFSSFMTDTWTVATIVAVAAGVVGFFVVLRGSAFAADALPTGAFAGAAGASLIGVSTLAGLTVFSLLGAVSIGLLGRRGRHDVATALTLVLMLGLGALFLSFSSEYAPEIYSLLFGEVLGISAQEVAPTAALAAVSVVAIGVMFRPLMLSTLAPESGEARGVRKHRVEIAFLLVIALVTSMALPVVGALLIFSLMIGPPAAARAFTDNPYLALALSVALSVVTVWAAIAAAYPSNWPIGFFVGSVSAFWYAVGRGWTAWRSRLAWRRTRAARAAPRDRGANAVAC
jgi:zinc/manganese transport system permease protein